MSKTFSCIRCFDTGYITLELVKNKVNYDFFFACSCKTGQAHVFNPIGKVFKNSVPCDTHVRDYRAALHQGYKLNDNFHHVSSVDESARTIPTVQRGCPVDH